MWKPLAPSHQESATYSVYFREAEVDVLDQIEKDVNELRERSKKFAERWEDSITAIENKFQQYEKALFAPEVDKLFVIGQQMVNTLMKRANKESKDAIVDHKDLHAPVSRIGKTIDRSMTKSISELMKQEKDLETDPKNQRLAERMIADYLVTAGLISAAEELDKVCITSAAGVFCCLL